MTEFSAALSSIEQIIDDARNGRMFILVDHEDRENEGDLVIPAQMCTPQAVNFMATHGRGLICLALTGERVDYLGLGLMSPKNSSRHETAFTMSIEARDGVSTGISAADRALTVAAAIDPSRGPSDLATPGHVFPLRARDGGVLVRAGHTEAAVDVARLAGLNPSGVICEIMNDDGTMARLPDLVIFSQKHNLNIGTIADLIAYRRRYDNMIVEKSNQSVISQFGGTWEMRIYSDQTHGADHIVLSKGDLTGDTPVLVRMHAHNPLQDVLGIGHGGGDMATSMEIIAQRVRGAVVLIRYTSKNLVPAEGEAPKTLRQYGVGAQILSALGLSKITLLSNSQAPKIVGLEAYGLSIEGTHPIEAN